MAPMNMTKEVIKRVIPTGENPITLGATVLYPSSMER
jgi:hypothetical protein